TFRLNKPLKSIVLDSAFIQVDSSKFISLVPEDFTYDSIFKKLSLNKSVHPDSLFKSKTFKTELILGTAAFISLENDSSKSQKHIITQTLKAQTGTLLLEVHTEEPYHIVQLLSTDGTVIQEIRNSKNITLNYLPAQNYKVRVIIDDNNNGKWDAGNPLQWIEPERVFFYQTADKKFEFPIRANWELGPLMLIF
ncbi:MAG: hypothetical protein RIA63_00900, partial [Cyclobacteriaceae bacterium]